MKKIDYILLFLMPSLQTAAKLLADRDANKTGADDEAAEAINYAIERLSKYLQG